MKTLKQTKQLDIETNPPRINEKAADWWKRIKGKPSWKKLTNDEKCITKLFVLLSNRTPAR